MSERVRAEHPRRGGPLRITDREGTLLAVSGETVDHLPSDLVESMRRNGYLEPVPDDEDEA